MKNSFKLLPKSLTQNSSGFGLIETLIACGILIMVAGATTALSVISIHGSIISKHKTEAYQLAIDALEQIRGARDKAWSDQDPSTNFDSSTSPFSEVKYFYINHQTGEITGPTGDPNLTGKGLRFTRTVNISPVLSTDFLHQERMKKVTVKVTWVDYNQSQEINLESYLTDWKPIY